MGSCCKKPAAHITESSLLQEHKEDKRQPGDVDCDDYKWGRLYFPRGGGSLETSHWEAIFNVCSHKERTSDRQVSWGELDSGGKANE